MRYDDVGMGQSSSNPKERNDQRSGKRDWIFLGIALALATGMWLYSRWIVRALAAPEFFDSYKKEFGHEPSYHSAAGYAGCMIYVEGVKRAGSIDADKVRDALLKLDMKTMFGEYKVDQDGFQVAHKMVLFQWHEGRKLTVWPDELSAAKPHFPTPPWNQR